jgi:hypothetical protein
MPAAPEYRTAVAWSQLWRCVEDNRGERIAPDAVAVPSPCSLGPLVEQL